MISSVCVFCGSSSRVAEAYRQAGILASDCDRPDIDIERFDHAENLMISIAIAQSGGALLSRREAATGSAVEMSDLTGYRQCLLQARCLFGMA